MFASRTTSRLWIAAGILLLIERDQGAARQHLPNQAFVLRLRSVAPGDVLRTRDRGDLVDPLLKRCWHALFLAAPDINRQSKPP